MLSNIILSLSFHNFAGMKSLMPLIFLFLLCSHAFPQSFSVGIIGGLASTDITGVDPVDGDEDFFRIGVVTGGLVNRSLNDRISLQMELLYSTKGSLQPPDSTNYYDKIRL